MTRRQFLNTTIAVAGSVKITGAPASRADLTELSLTELLSRLRTRALSPAEAAEAYSERIGRLDRELHAYVTIAADSRDRVPGTWQHAALAIRVVRRADRPQGSLRNRGNPHRRGSRLFERYVPGRDATLVARLSRRARSRSARRTRTSSAAASRPSTRSSARPETRAIRAGSPAARAEARRRQSRPG